MIGLALLLVTVSGAPTAATPATVPWTEVRAAIAELICARAYKLPDGRESSSVVPGDRAFCELPEAVTPLQRSVDAAYERAQPLIASIHSEELDASYEPGLSIGERTQRARAAYLASEDFLRAVVPRLREAMLEAGLSCSGCPEFPPRPIRRVSWAVFSPYLAAYVWPDPVRTPKDASGKATGMPKYSFHICGGLNGIGEMQDPDPLLVRLGFVVAFRNREFREAVGFHFQEALNEPAFQALVDDDARTRYLRKRLPQATVADPMARAAACRALAEVAGDLGVEVPDCIEAKAHP